MYFIDSETAASAVRNLNNYEIGGRQLRVDFANESDADNYQPGSSNSANNSNSSRYDEVCKFYLGIHALFIFSICFL